MSGFDLVADKVLFALELLCFCFKLLCIVVTEGVLSVWPKKQKDLRGEVVLITGSGQGMGRQLAINVGRMGAKVVLWDINETKVKEVAEEIIKDGGNAIWCVCDVTSEIDVNAKAMKVEEMFGDVSILVNNAGIMQNLPILKLDSKRIIETLDVNLLSHFWTIRAFLPKMQWRNRGHIVAIASGAGLMGHVNQTDYSASKHGVVGMMEAFSEELRLTNSDIKLTTICPLTVTTGMNQNPVTRCSWLMPVVSIEEAVDQILNAIRREDFLVTIPGTTLWLLTTARFFPRKVLSEFLDFTDYCRVPNAESDKLSAKIKQ